MYLVAPNGENLNQPSERASRLGTTTFPQAIQLHRPAPLPLPQLNITAPTDTTKSKGETTRDSIEG